jgi:hypothetical protein
MTHPTPIDEREIDKRKTDERIGHLVPQFKILMAVQCNTCGARLFANSSDVDADHTSDALQAGLDTWKQSGSTDHRCRRRRKALK